MVVLHVVSAGQAAFEVQPQRAGEVVVKHRRLVPHAVDAVQVHVPVAEVHVLPVVHDPAPVAEQF